MSSEFNPYQPPISELESDGEASIAEIAGKGRRFGTFMVDYLCVLLCGGVLGFVVALCFGKAGIDAIRSIPDIVFGWIIMLGYYAFFEGIWARTPGKLVFGTVVITDEGHKPGFSQILKRTACRFIPFEAFTFFGERGLHDKYSDTRVVRVR